MNDQSINWTHPYFVVCITVLGLWHMMVWWILEVNHFCFILNLTLNAFALTPLVVSSFRLALKEMSLTGSIGSLTRLFSANDSSSSIVSFEKAPSSISDIRFPVRSILLKVTAISTHFHVFTFWHRADTGHNLPCTCFVVNVFCIISLLVRLLSCIAIDSQIQKRFCASTNLAYHILI